MTFNKKQNDFIKEVTQKNESDYIEQNNFVKELVNKYDLSVKELEEILKDKNSMSIDNHWWDYIEDVVDYKKEED